MCGNILYKSARIQFYCSASIMKYEIYTKSLSFCAKKYMETTMQQRKLMKNIHVIGKDLRHKPYITISSSLS